MLQNLHVKNLALIDETDVEFESGLNILTGETGAGKSIIIGSMNLALGEKVSKEMLRDNENPALVELTFYVDNPITLAKLKELDIEPEDGYIVLSRKVTAQRSIGRINGETVPVAQMKEAAALLIDIYGQSESQTFVAKKKQLAVLDAYIGGDFSKKKEEVSTSYKTYKKLLAEWEKANIDTTDQKRELSLLEYEAKEIEEAQLVVGEDEELENLYRKYANGKKIMEALAIAHEATGGDDASASELIGRAVRELQSVADYDAPLENLEKQLSEIDSLLSDFNHEISGYIDDTDFDDETFYETEKRLDLINHLKSKYGNTISDILDAYQQKVTRIEQLNDYENYLNTLSESIAKQKTHLDKISEQISDIRKKKAAKLTQEVTEALRDLNFLDVKFEMHFSKLEDYTANGFDDAEFMISTNPGEPLKPLGKVASGGELSRIMLGLKTVMAESDDLDTLIFDEIDSGISGRTAQMVSEKLNQLGRKHQIICITHLPQIAAMADAHFLIEKEVENKATVSHIHRLKEEDSVHELARMLGGVEITETVIQNAREMKTLATKKK